MSEQTSESEDVYVLSPLQALPSELRTTAYGIAAVALGVVVLVAVLVILGVHSLSPPSPSVTGGLAGTSQQENPSDTTEPSDAVTPPGMAVPGDTAAPPDTTQPTGSVQPTDTAGNAGSEASTIDGLLQQDSRDRQSVESAFADVQACGTSISSDSGALSQAATDHTSLAGQVGQADVSAIPGGEQAQRDLVTVLQDSATADQDFANWGQAMQNGCDTSTNTQNPDCTAGMSASQAATTDKNTFVQEWNPIAQTYGLTQWSADNL